MRGSFARLCDPGRDLGLWPRWTWTTLSPDFGATAAGAIAGPFAGRIGELRAARLTSHEGSLPRMGATWTGHFAATSGLLLFAIMTPRGVEAEPPGAGDTTTTPVATPTPNSLEEP